MSSDQLPDIKGSFIREYEDSSASEISFDHRVMRASKLSLFEMRKTSGTMSAMPTLSNVLKNWAEASKINYIASQHYENISSRPNYFGRKVSDEESVLPARKASEEQDTTPTNFPSHLTPLLNEDHLWGCFYVYPELYDDEYSPVVRVKSPESVPPLVDGVLVRDMVAVCLSYLRRTPILKDYAYIKLDLSSKGLTNIQVLQHYKYLVYLDLSANILTDLSVLSFLPYLQHLNVSYNRLNQVLEYETPQWFLTEVYYKYNSVKRINDLTKFWSLVILDLSHNNIKRISGLENLMYLRRLDLSFNHIQRIENLNHLNLVWLDLSYNNISSYEFSHTTGLWTLLQLEYLNINENNLGSLKLFVACSRLRELHARNNRFSTLLELTVYMRQLRKLIVLDLRSNEVCTVSGYREVVITTFPSLLSFDAEEVDPVQQRINKMEAEPDVMTFANRRLMRLLYVEQLSRAKLSPFVPQADTTEVPLVVLVGYEAVGKGDLARRLAKECNVELGLLHTTADYHFLEHYIYVSRRDFDDKLLAGDILAYTEMYGQSYGLSREQACISNGKIKIVCLDLIGALMLRLRGRRPFLILASCQDKAALIKRQQERREFQISLQKTNLDRKEKSTLQVMISGTILVTGIINELVHLATIPDEVIEDNKFVVESECSLFMDSQTRPTAYNYARAAMLNNLLQSRSSSLNVTTKDHAKENDDSGMFPRQENSIASLYNEAAEDINVSDLQIRETIEKSKRNPKSNAADTLSPNTMSTKSYSQESPTNFKAYTKFAKSVTFTGKSATSPENLENDGIDLSGMIIDPLETERGPKIFPKSISAKLESLPLERPAATTSDNDLWLAFLAETGVSAVSETAINNPTDALKTVDLRNEDPEFMFQQLGYYRRIPSAGRTMKIRDDYEDIHRAHPGLFWDTVSFFRTRFCLQLCLRALLQLNMDDPDAAFKKMKNILKSIVETQPNLKPMFDSDFANMDNYPTVKKRLQSVYKQIAPQRLFY